MKHGANLTENTHELNSDSERLNLYWLCTETGRHHSAGVAFYNEGQGDYRLKIDLMPDDKLLYLKATSRDQGMTRFRVETAVRKAGRVTHRAEVGSGFGKDGEAEIYIDLGPFSRTLVLETGA